MIKVVMPFVMMWCVDVIDIVIDVGIEVGVVVGVLRFFVALSVCVCVKEKEGERRERRSEANNVIEK